MKCNEYASILSDQNVLKALDFNDSVTDWNLVQQPIGLPDSGHSDHIPQSSFNDEGNRNEDSDFSDVVLNYINQMLMEEDVEEKNCMFQDSAALQAAEESFLNVLMVNDHDHGHDQVQDQAKHQDQDYAPAADESLYNLLMVNDQDEDPAGDKSLYNVLTVEDQDQGPAAESIVSFGINRSMNGADLTYDISESSLLPNTMISFDYKSRFHPSYSLFSSNSNFIDGFMNSPVSILSFPDMVYNNRSTTVQYLPFQNGIDEASWFLPNGRILDGSTGKRNFYSKDLAERNLKQSAVYSEPTVRSKMFDDVLLCGGTKSHPFQCDFVCKSNAYKGQLDQTNRSYVVKARGKKHKEVVDLRTLLTLCAQSVSINDQRGVTDLLKRIREHASHTGNGMQRMAHYFSAGLEARMAGSGTEIYKSLLSIPTSAVDVLKAYRLFLGCFPFTKVFHFVSNKTIMSVAENKTKLHIIDFGILYGFQWPCLIQQLSTRPGGPPELRITGVDFPCPGFRPSQRVEETGRRLANYAETFGVRFKFKAIAQKWETIRMEDLELDDDETLVVNCGYRFRNLLDETVLVDSPRNKVLHLIRKMKPEIFVQGILNGSYGVPFFLTRFREALFFFSSLFDMLDATVNPLTEERMLVEKTMWGREAMNVIACEDGERIERPESYKQWQVRNQRAGFRQVAFDQEILKKAKDKGTSDYHKDFIIDEDGYWMLQGWKGRILYAISSWKPAY